MVAISILEKYTNYTRLVKTRHFKYKLIGNIYAYIMKLKGFEVEILEDSEV